MIHIEIDPSFRKVCPAFVGGAIEAEVRNGETPPALWQEMESATENLRRQFSADTLKLRSGIAATRAAYKAAGKDPSRYRPACEQLARRVIQGKDLYSVDLLVDLGNLVSLVSGYSTGALDANAIEGGRLCLGIGHADEPYEGIGRGRLNIESLPVYRDALGGVATPTSDSTRTMLSSSTRRLLLLVNGYDGRREAVEQALRLTQDLLTRFAASDGGRYWLFGAE